MRHWGCVLWGREVDCLLSSMLSEGHSKPILIGTVLDLLSEGYF